MQTIHISFTAPDGRIPDASKLARPDHAAVMREVAKYIDSLSAGHEIGSFTMTTDDGDAEAATGSISVSGASHGTAATGSYALSGVGGTAASGTVTLGGGAGNVTIVTDGTSVGPVAFNTSDAQTALDCITALNANGTFAAKATASTGGSAVVLITWNTKGTVGNSKTLTSSRSAGTATASGATLASGAQGAVTLTINGTAVGPVNTTALTDTAAATAVAAAIEADATLGPLLVAAGSVANVTLAWGTRGTVGNAITLAVGVSATGTATRSGATLSGGANTSVLVTINGVGLTVNTTTTSTDAGVATAIAADINASESALVDGVVTASPDGADVDLVADTKGTAGNMITLAVSGTGLSVSGNRLTGGTDDTTASTVEF